MKLTYVKAFVRLAIIVMIALTAYQATAHHYPSDVFNNLAAVGFFLLALADAGFILWEAANHVERGTLREWFVDGKGSDVSGFMHLLIAGLWVLFGLALMKV